MAAEKGGSGELLSSEEVDFLLDGERSNDSGAANNGGQEPAVVTMRGDLEQMPLTDIFQTLALTKMAGMLRVRNPIEQRHVYFKDGYVRVLVPNRLVARRLGQRLIHAGVLEPEALRTALLEQRKENLPLGEILVQKGYVARERIEEVIGMQVTEDLFSIFTWRHGTFEFFKGECREPQLLSRLEACPEFEVNSLLLEVARRSDEWEGILTTLGSLEEVPKIPDGMAIPDDLDDAPRALLLHADGMQTFRELSETALLTLFDAARAAHDLVRRGCLVHISDEDMVQVALRAVHDGHHKRALMVMQTLRDRPGERPMAVITAMADVLKEAGESKVASRVLLATAQLQTDPQVTLDLARRARAMSGRDTEILMFLRNALLTHGGAARERDVEEITFDLLDLLIENGECDLALSILDEIPRDGEEDVSYQIRRARALQRKKDVPAATAVLMELAANAALQGERARAVEFYEQVLKLDRDRKDVAKTLRQLRTSARARFIRVMAIVATLIVVSGLGVVMWSQARRQSDLMAATDSVTRLVKLGKLGDAREELTRWRAVFADGVEMDDLQRQIDFAAAAEKTRRLREAQHEAETQLSEAAKAIDAGDIAAAFPMFERLSQRADIGAEAGKLLDTQLEGLSARFDNLARTLASHLPPEPDLLLDRRTLEENFSSLRTRFTPELSQLAEQLRLAATQSRFPKCATQETIDKLMHALVVADPVLQTARQRYQQYDSARQRMESERRLDPLFKAAIESERQLDFAEALKAYRRLEIEHTDQSLRAHFRDMVARNATIVRYLDAIAAATSNGDFATAQSQFRALKLAYPEVPFERCARLPLRIESVPSGAAVTWNGEEQGVTPLALTFSPDGSNQVVLRLPRFRNEQATLQGDQQGLLRRVLTCVPDAEVELTGVSEQQGRAGGHGRVFVTDRSGSLSAIDAQKGTVAWTWRSGDLSGLLTSPQLHEDKVITASLDGTVRALNVGDGTVAWSLPHLPTEVEPALDNGILAVVTTGNQLALVRAADGKPGATVNLPAAVHTNLVVTEHLLITCLANGTVLAHELSRGENRWQARTPGGPLCATAVPGGVAIADDTGRITVFDLTAKTRWQVSMGSAVVGRPSHNGKELAVVLQDRIVLLDLRTGAISASLPAGDQGFSGPATFVGDRVLVPHRDGRVDVLGARSLEPRYRLGGEQRVSAPLTAIAGQGVLVPLDNRRVLIFANLP